MSKVYLDPQADNLRDNWTILVGDTPAAGNEATVTIEEMDCSFFVGTTVTTASVADSIQLAINANSPTHNLVDGEGWRNRGGQETGVFQAVVASDEGSTLRLISDMPGHSFVPTVSVAGGGLTLGTPVHVETATGKMYMDSIANFGGAIAGSNDTIILANSSQDMTDGFVAYESFENISLDIDDTFLGSLGRKRINTDVAAFPYPETSKRTHFPLKAKSTGVQVIDLGTPGGTAVIDRFAYLDLGSVLTGTSLTVNVNNMPARTSAGEAKVDIIGGDDMSLECIKGAVDVGTKMDEQAVTSIAGLIVRAEGDVVIGTNCSIDSSLSGPFIMYGGTLHLGVSHGSMEIEVRGGTLHVEKDFAQSADIHIFPGGTIVTDGVLIDLITLDDGCTIDATNDPGSTITNCNMNGNVNWIDPNNRLTRTNPVAWTPAA